MASSLPPLFFMLAENQSFELLPAPFFISLTGIAKLVRNSAFSEYDNFKSTLWWSDRQTV